MKKMFVFAVLMMSAHAGAKEVSCMISQNLEPVSQMTIFSEPGKKMAIDRVEGISAYITEKDNNLFILEAYLLDYDVRGYSEGHLHHPSDKLTFALWGRDSVVEIACSLAQ